VTASHVAALLLAALLAALGPGCGRASDRPGAEEQPSDSASDTQPFRVVQHEEPRRDFVGPRPARFRWSAITGADRYAIGLWNDADRMRWRRDDLTAPAVEWPEGLYADPGTYFWSVSALQHGREIAKSGMAAFVVE
jgi:hypothetical protein